MLGQIAEVAQIAVALGRASVNPFSLYYTVRCSSNLDQTCSLVMIVCRLVACLGPVITLSLGCQNHTGFAGYRHSLASL